MTHPVRNRIAIMLVAAVMLFSFAIEEAGAERRRRKQKCNNRAVIEVTVDAYNFVKRQHFMNKTFRMDRGGCCSGYLGDCRYTGPDKNALFNEWKQRYRTEASSLIKFFQQYKFQSGQSRGTIIFGANCEGRRHHIHQGRLNGTRGGKLVMSQ